MDKSAARATTPDNGAGRLKKGGGVVYQTGEEGGPRPRAAKSRDTPGTPFSGVSKPSSAVHPVLSDLILF